MKATLDWNYERYRTRDLLLEYDKSIMPPRPRAAGLSNIYSWGSTIPTDADTLDAPVPIQKNLSIIYPWENTTLGILSSQLYQISRSSGFVGTMEDFSSNFGKYLQVHPLICANYADFPESGDSTNLYFDLNEKILYYWQDEYIPVNAMLLANAIINCNEEPGG